MEKDIRQLGFLGLGLLVLMVIVGVIFLVGGAFLDALCVQEDSTYTYTGTSCVNSTGGTVTDPASVVASEAILAVVTTLIGFISIVVIIGIAKIITKIAKGMGQ
jgi:hypothetical protein